jgi:putative endonuclease
MNYYFVDIPKSKVDNNFYTGYTSDLKQRSNQHNSGNIPSTRKRIPLELVYWEGCLNQHDAT